MAEYIEREAGLTELCRGCSLHSAGDNFFCGSACPKYERIAAIPAADVRPVVRGKWSKELHPNVRYNQYKCSACGEFSGHDSDGWIWKPKFCPNCGADMREANDEKA